MTPQDQSTVQSVVQDAIDDTKLGAALLSAWKTKGKDGLIALLPDTIAAAKKDIADVQAFIPLVKAGYKTSEFWLFVLSPAVNALVFWRTGQALPFNLNALWLSGATVYAVVRMVVKGKAATVAPTVVVAAAPAK